MNVNFGLTAKDYATHRAGFPGSFFERVGAYGVGLPSQTIVDLGTGTGTVARGFAQRGGQVMGIDPSVSLMAQAKQLDELAGVVVEYRVGRAEETGLAAQSVDVVSAGQCWHWFDRPRAAQEVARILRPDGVVVIAHFDWLPLKGNVVEATEQLIMKHNPQWHLGGGYGLYPAWLRDLGEAGFRQIETFSYDEPAIYTPVAWRGRIRASAGVGASLSPEQVAIFDQELATILAEKYPGEQLAIPHRVFAVIARAPL